MSYIEEHEEIVALRFESFVSNDPARCRALIAAGEPFQFVTRGMAHMMSDMDLGKNWDNLASAPTLFTRTRLKVNP